ncbi:hypothetical protein BASA61_001105 [Batrachochytrium salamandrivorans]|nr:hypothetical protein BASA62_009097 [Batrachochytrium salamandrivorans]KAH6602443.1 hypothetical protein BASA61_001105 [Batrachochytrium salamandrivorans]
MLATTICVASLAVASVYGARQASTDSTISYTVGAPVMTRPLTVHYIYYGSWSAAQKSIVEDFTNGVGKSGWWGVQKNYYSQASATAAKVPVSGSVRLGSTIVDNYTFGKALSGTNVPDLIQQYVASGALPNSADAVYVVLTASDVTESMRTDALSASFCRDYCGYHLTTTLSSGTRVPYIMAGIPTGTCLGGCAPLPNVANSPNGDVGVDAMVATLAGQMAGVVTNPQSDGTRAWQDISGFEGNDLCSFSFGSTIPTANGAASNVGWNKRRFLIQQNWDPSKQTCTMGTPDAPIPSPIPSTTTSIIPSPMTSTAISTVTSTKRPVITSAISTLSRTTRTTSTRTSSRKGQRTPTPVPRGPSCDPKDFCCIYLGHSC